MLGDLFNTCHIAALGRCMLRRNRVYTKTFVCIGGEYNRQTVCVYDKTVSILFCVCEKTIIILYAYVIKQSLYTATVIL